MLQAQRFTFNPLREHTYVLYDDTKACAVIDPGCSNPGEEKVLSRFLADKQLTLQHVLNTHGHIDHTVGNHYLKEAYGLSPKLHPADLSLVEGTPPYGTAFGMPNYTFVQPDTCLAGGGTVTFGNTTLHVLHVPGHSPGHVAFYYPEGQRCWVGDVLFKGSVGRTDLPGGDMPTLLRSIKEQLLPLGPATKIYAGHGPNTTVEEELADNPYLVPFRS